MNRSVLATLLFTVLALIAFAANAVLGRMAFVFEPVTIRLAVAGVLILGGILLDMLGRYKFGAAVR